MPLVLLDDTCLRVPVISFKAGLTDAVQDRLLAAESPASELLRAGKLQLVEIPVPIFPSVSKDSNQSQELDGQPLDTLWDLTSEQEKVLEDAQIVLADAHYCAPILLNRGSEAAEKQHLLKKVQWVQSTYAGVDAYQKLIDGKTEKKVPGFIVTRAGGIKGMAQFVFGWIITLERKFIEAKKYQEEGVYAKAELSYRSYRSLTVGMLGFGAIGQAIGQLLKAAGFQVTGFKRRPAEEESDALLKSCANRISNDLDDVLRTSDFIVSILPSTPATKYLLTEEKIAVCADKKPVFINVGRGDVISEQTLLRALDRGYFSKIVLDVFEKEPLPQDSALWTHPGVHLTPHISARCFIDDVADVFFDNLNLFLAEKPMNYVMDWSVHSTDVQIEPTITQRVCQRAPHFDLMASSSSSAAARLRIPVVSYIQGMGDAVRARLHASSSPAAELFRASQLEIVDVAIPEPQPSSSSLPVHWSLDAKQEQALQEAHVVLADAQTLAPLILTPRVTLPSKHHELLSQVRWVQSTYAGVEAYHKLLTSAVPSTLSNVKAEKGNEPVFTVTRAGGIMPTAMAQYVMGWIIALERKFLEAKKFQEQRVYARQELDYRPFRSLTVGILGFGDIGQGIGRLLKLSGFQVVGFKRTLSTGNENDHDAADRVTTDLQDVLSAADFVVSVLPSTSATTHFLNASNLQVCRAKQPVFINVGRGSIIAESTLVEMLDQGVFSKAVLDVFEVEPLPKESALWAHSNVYMTPHVSATSFPEDVADVFISNLNLYLANKPMQYTVDWTRGY